MQEATTLLNSSEPRLSHVRTLHEAVPGWERWVRAAIVVASVLLVATGWWLGTFQGFFRFTPHMRLGSASLWSLISYGSDLLYFDRVENFALAGLQTYAACFRERVANCFVVIPAYNEGPLVQQCVLSVTDSDYPRNKLRVIVVDDGSTDDTWHYIEEAAREAPIKVITIRNPENRGKRHALYTGFQRATGEVWATVDSDSILEPDALRNGVSPLVRDPRIGCVAGCVKVLNRNASLITRFLKVSFSLSFKFSRAYQSQIRGLLTTPGALSIYRAATIKPVLEKWLCQTFLGAPCMTGEDRALTNLITEQGFHSVFQSTAVVWSSMPATYSGMVKMFLRWARSNIRETIVLFSFLFKRFRSDYLWGFRINSLLIASTLVVPYLFIVQSYAFMLTNPFWLFRYAVVVTVLSLPMTLIYLRNEKDADFAWVIAFEFFWVLTCQWIMPYAFLTCRRQGTWITRGPERNSSTRKPWLHALSESGASSRIFGFFLRG